MVRAPARSKHRGFCGVCGSPIVNRRDGVQELGIALGGLDDDPGVRPERHFYVVGKAPWFEITDNLPQHAELGGFFLGAAAAFWPPFLG